MTNPTNNQNWTATDAATNAAMINANRAVVDALTAQGWEIVDSFENCDEVGVKISVTFELLSPEGVAMQISIEEPEWATEARSN